MRYFKGLEKACRIAEVFKHDKDAFRARYGVHGQSRAWRRWTPRKTLLLRPDNNFLFLYSSNIPIYYPVLETSNSLSAHQNRGF
jgi:hypothetical protein